MGAVTDPCRCANFGTDRQQRVVLCRPRPSDDNWHRCDDRRGDRPIVLGHDDDPQRLDTSAASSEIGGVGGRHRPGRLLVLQLLHHHIRPAMAQHILHLPPIDSLVCDHHQCRVITAGHTDAAHVAPSIPMPRRSIAHIAQPTSQPANGVRQASRQVQRDDGKAPGGCLCRPLACHTTMNGSSVAGTKHMQQIGRCAANHFRCAAPNVSSRNLRDVLPDRDHRLSEGRRVEGSAMDFRQSDCHANQRLQIAIEPATPVAR
jgi:hypothetical protein